MEIILDTPNKSLDFMFKIDFIVWKYTIVPSFNMNFNSLKQTLQYGNGDLKSKYNISIRV